MRWIILAAAAALLPAPAIAGCQTRTIGETFERFVPVLQAALAADGISALSRVGSDGQQTILVVPHTNVGVRLVEKDGLLEEVGTDVLPSASNRDRDMFGTIGAAMVAHLSGTTERQVKDDIYAGLHAHPAPGSFTLRWSSTAAAITRLADGGLVAKIGKLDCD